MDSVREGGVREQKDSMFLSEIEVDGKKIAEVVRVHAICSLSLLASLWVQLFKQDDD